jgi:hypothetical protein
LLPSRPQDVKPTNLSRAHEACYATVRSCFSQRTLHASKLRDRLRSTARAFAADTSKSF